MACSVKDITDKTFGRLTVIGPSSKRVKGTAYWWCQCSCGNLYVGSGRALRQGNTRSCGCLKKEKTSGPLHPRWNGGRSISKDGYVRMSLPEHPRANSSGYVLEHIVSYEKAFGVTVPLGWTIHHKNGNRSDNAPENLELWRHGHPHGQRPQDVIASLVNLLGKDRVITMTKEVQEKYGV